jgi:catechol 2,3-dioxygenase-like lactoylglutathione lyase family enzyme
MKSRLALSLLVLVALAGWAGAADVPTAHFHHVHLNVTNPAKTVAFYKRICGAVGIQYHDKEPALFVERSFILLNKVDEAPPWEPHTALSHMGWATVDGQSQYEWLKAQKVDFETEIGQLGNNYGMYIYGPDKELIEFWTGSRNHRFEHLHLWATDVEKSAVWFRDNLGLAARIGPQPTIKDKENIGAIRMAFLQCDNVNLVFFGRPDFESRWWPGGSYTAADGPQGDFEPTKGHTIDHIAFSYRDIQPVFDRMKAAGVEIVEPIAVRPEGHTSFFVMAPDHILVEIVQARPIPESSWDE